MTDCGEVGPHAGGWNSCNLRLDHADSRPPDSPTAVFLDPTAIQDIVRRDTRPHRRRKTVTDSLIKATRDTADALVIGAPYAGPGVKRRDAALGPRRIFGVLHCELEFYERFSGAEPAYDFAFGNEMLTSIDGIEFAEMVTRLKHRLVQEHGRFICLIGGTHSTSIGALEALSQNNESTEITIVQIDAHLDLRDTDADYNDVNPSPYAHSCVMRRAHEMGYRIVPVGVRTMSHEESTYAREHGIMPFEWGRNPGDTSPRANWTEPPISRIIESIETECVYLTIDVDGFDPSVMPGTLTPVPGGVSWQYGRALIWEIAKSKHLIGADIVEVAPQCSADVTPHAAAQLCYDILALSQRS